MTAPSIVAWETTRRCELACHHCRAVAGPAADAAELTTGEAHRLVAALAALPTRLLILTGGEPMARADIYALAAYASARGIRVVMAPCGPLLTKDTAARIKASGVSAVSISIDAPTAKDHDDFRGVPGAFDAALRGLRCARAAGLPVQVNTTVTRLNVAQLPALLALAEHEGASTLDCFFLVPTGRGRELADLQVDAATVESTLHWILDMDASRPIHVKSTCAPQMARVRAQRGIAATDGRTVGGCMAGRGFLFIGQDGTVKPCGFLDRACGNVRDYDFDLRTLVTESETLTQLRSQNGIGGRCGGCTYLDACGGCRARAFETAGNVLGEEPFCIMART